MIPTYYTQPTTSWAGAPLARSDGRAQWALIAAVAGVATGLAGVLLGGYFLVSAGGNLGANFALESPFLNGCGVGIPALALGPLAYFLGKSSVSRIAASDGHLNGRATASAASGIGVAATVIGALATLGWIVLTLLGFFGTPPV